MSMKAEVFFAFDFFHTKRIAGNDVVSGPITALAAVSPQRNVNIFWGGAHQALAVDAWRVGKDVSGP